MGAGGLEVDRQHELAIPTGVDCPIAAFVSWKTPRGEKHIKETEAIEESWSRVQLDAGR